MNNLPPSSSSAKQALPSLRFAFILLAVGGAFAAMAPGCGAEKAAGGLAGVCNDDAICDDDEECDCGDCDDVCGDTTTSTTTSTSSGAGGSTSSSATGATTTTTAASTTSAATTTTASTTATTGSGGPFTCADVEGNSPDPCAAADAAACECLGCALPACDDGNGGYNDCICPNCANDPFCSDPSNCADDGQCDPFGEGCVCADCQGHPLCQ